MEMEDIIIIKTVLKFFLNKYVIIFLSKHMQIGMFLKFFIQNFIAVNEKSIGDYFSEQKEVYPYLFTIAKVYIFNRLHYNNKCNSNKYNNISSYTKKPNDDIYNTIQLCISELLQTEMKEKKKESNITYFNFNDLEKNKIYHIKQFINIDFQINESLILSIYEKMIASFKAAYFFNPLFLSMLLFFASDYFPLECQNIFYSDDELIKILAKNIFIHFYNSETYVVFTKSTFYGKKENNYLVDITSILPPILSFFGNLKCKEINSSLKNYFQMLNSHYTHFSFIYFIFLVQNKLRDNVQLKTLSY